MNYKLILVFFCSVFLFSCEQNNLDKFKKVNLKIEKKYKNTGFALVYNDNLENISKLNERSLNIYHKSLKKKSTIKITNPKNGKSLIAEVRSNKVKFSEFYNSIITSRISEILELNMNDPYVEIILISKHSTFIAKKAKTFEEEKEVAEKAPIDGIQINDLNNTKTNKKDIAKEIFSYSIKIADFYYKDTAEMMIDRIKNETLLKNSKIIQLSKTKYRVLIGPFNDIKTMKESFEKIKSLNFENIEILRNV
jgi:hypothetical protein